MATPSPAEASPPGALSTTQRLELLAVFATGGLLSLGSLVGFVTLFGIATRNAVMLVSHYDHLVGREGVPWGPEAAIRGAMERLGPILMTALVTGLGLLPLAVGSVESTVSGWR